MKKVRNAKHADVTEKTSRGEPNNDPPSLAEEQNIQKTSATKATKNGVKTATIPKRRPRIMANVGDNGATKKLIWLPIR